MESKFLIIKSLTAKSLTIQKIWNKELALCRAEVADMRFILLFFLFSLFLTASCSYTQRIRTAACQGCSFHFNKEGPDTRTRMKPHTVKQVQHKYHASICRKRSFVTFKLLEGCYRKKLAKAHSELKQGTSSATESIWIWKT